MRAPFSFSQLASQSKDPSIVLAFLQGRNLDHDGLPVNQAAGMGVHESQSLLWERMVALGRPFAAYLLPLMREHFPEVRLQLICGALQ